jgi:hypothetical protein
MSIQEGELYDAESKELEPASASSCLLLKLLLQQ